MICAVTAVMHAAGLIKKQNNGSRRFRKIQKGTILMTTVQDLAKKELEVLSRPGFLMDPDRFFMCFAEDNDIDVNDPEVAAAALETVKEVLEKIAAFEKGDGGLVIMGAYYVDAYGGGEVYDVYGFSKEQLDEFKGFDDLGDIDPGSMSKDEKLAFLHAHELPDLFAFDLLPWKETASMEAYSSDDDPEAWGELLSGILNEMTFFGTDPGDTDREREIIEDRIKETDKVLALPEEERSQYFVSADDFFAGFEIFDNRTEEEKAEEEKRRVNVVFDNWLTTYGLISGYIKNCNG